MTLDGSEAFIREEFGPTYLISVVSPIMKITCVVELEIPEKTLASEVEEVVGQIRATVQGNVPEWAPKITLQLPFGVEDKGHEHTRRC